MSATTISACVSVLEQLRCAFGEELDGIVRRAFETWETGRTGEAVEATVQATRVSVRDFATGLRDPSDEEEAFAREDGLFWLDARLLAFFVERYADVGRGAAELARVQWSIHATTVSSDSLAPWNGTTPKRLRTLAQVVWTAIVEP